MRRISKKPAKLYGVLVAFASLLVVTFSIATQADAQSVEPAPGERLVTVHDAGRDKGFLTRAHTLRQALQQANIPLDPNDIVEPSLNAELVAKNYDINIYRARPVTVVDGAIRQKIMSPYQTAKQIAAHAGITLHDEDLTELSANTNMVSEGAGIQLNITRATEFTFVLYGKKMTAYTMEKTVGGMLKSKNITMAADDSLSVPAETVVAKGMTVELWRNGKQTVAEDRDIPFAVEKIKDMDREVGYREVRTPGKLGKRTVVYEVDMRNGQEVGRVEIQSTVTQEPEKQVEVVGGKMANTFSGSFAEALARLRSCEGSYTSNTGNGYYGAYQFDRQTWGSYGGYAVASDAPPSVQDEKAWLTYQRRGWQPWPTCSRKMGLQDIYR